MTEAWPELEFKLRERFGRIPDLQSILFLIGIDVLSQGSTEFSKEEKQDLIHIGICQVLSYSGYFEMLGRDEDGWPHFKELESIQAKSLAEQELVLKTHVLEYFKRNDFLEINENS
jgi:hypothetical protein